MPEHELHPVFEFAEAHSGRLRRISQLVTEVIMKEGMPRIDIEKRIGEEPNFMEGAADPDYIYATKEVSESEAAEMARIRNAGEIARAEMAFASGTIELGMFAVAQKKTTVEQLMLDPNFVRYCRTRGILFREEDDENGRIYVLSNTGVVGETHSLDKSQVIIDDGLVQQSIGITAFDGVIKLVSEDIRASSDELTYVLSALSTMQTKNEARLSISELTLMLSGHFEDEAELNECISRVESQCEVGELGDGLAEIMGNVRERAMAARASMQMTSRSNSNIPTLETLEMVEGLLLRLKEV